MDNNRKTLLIDLDGVLNIYEENFQKNYIPKLKSGAYQFLEYLAQEYNIKIFTTRNKILTVKWLIENHIDCFICDVTNIKDLAYLYIDDRCICFNGNYKDTINNIKNFKPHWDL